MKESSSIRITVGGRDALEAGAPGAHPLEEQPGGRPEAQVVGEWRGVLLLA